jgi:hypothetical protein
MPTSPIRLRIVAVTVTAVLAASAAFTATATATARPAAPSGSAVAVRSAAATTRAVPASRPEGKVVSRLPLSIRERPTTDSRRLGSLAAGSVVPLSCKVRGRDVDGNDLWYRLWGRSGWVAARYVRNLSPVSYCS